MTTFFQAIGYIALSVIILALLDMIYFKHFGWRNSNKIYTPYYEGEQT